MLQLFQTTISRPVNLRGIGLHTGNKTSVKILPGDADQGIIFKRVDLNKDNLIEANFKNVLDENPSEKERFKNGEKKLSGFFMGKIMKASKGTADPKKSAQLLNKLINQ